MISTDRLVACMTLAWMATAVAAESPTEKHPFGIDDYSALHSAHVVAVSPDGKQLLYDLRTDGDKGPTKHEWRLIDVGGVDSSRLELPEKFEPSGFTRDGDLFGISKANKLSQFAIVPRTAGQPTLSFGLPNNIQAAIVAPNGKRFALLADARPRDALQAVHTVIENDERSLYVINAAGADGAWWCPNLRFITEIAWSSDATRIAVVTQVPKIGNHELRSAVSVCDASGSRQIVDI